MIKMTQKWPQKGPQITDFPAWGLVSVYNMAGHDGRQDYDMIEQPCDWDTLVMEEHAHEFKDGDVFDPNQELYRVSFPTLASWILTNFKILVFNLF